MAKSADAFRTISEVAQWLETPAHVLRFWESKFSQIKPVKRAGGRRYYRPSDMRLLGGIKKLLHDDGMTIKGVQKILREQGIRHVADLSPPLEDRTAAEVSGIALDVEAGPAKSATVLNFQKSDDTAEAGQEIVEDRNPEPAPDKAEPEEEEHQPVVSRFEITLDSTARTPAPRDGAAESDTPPSREAEHDTATDTTAAPSPPPPEENADSSEGIAPDTGAAGVDNTHETSDMVDHAASPNAEDTGEGNQPEAPFAADAGPDVPDGPPDDIDAPTGLLGHLAGLDRPVSADLAAQLAPAAARLRTIVNGPQG